MFGKERESKMFILFYFWNNVFEKPFFPSICWMRHHCENGVVILLVFIVKENQLCPQMRLLCCPEDLSEYKT